MASKTRLKAKSNKVALPPSGTGIDDTRSRALAELATTSALTCVTLKVYSGDGDDLHVSDLLTEMRKAGDEVVAGDLCRVERMLSNQVLALDALFNNLAQRSSRQESFKGIEVLMRLALKAQAQARATAETLAVMKNPMPYIKQANIANGPQQVNNVPPLNSGSCAENSQSAPNKLLEAEHGNALDRRATSATSRTDQTLETVGEVHRA